MLTRSMSMLVPRASMAPVNSESYLTFIGSRTTTGLSMSFTIGAIMLTRTQHEHAYAVHKSRIGRTVSLLAWLVRVRLVEPTLVDECDTSRAGQGLKNLDQVVDISGVQVTSLKADAPKCSSSLSEPGRALPGERWLLRSPGPSL